MTLERQTVQLPFTGGLDTKTDAKHVPAAKLLTLENGVFSTPGVIKKRFGHKALSATLTSATGLFAYRDELLAMQRGGELYSLRDATDAMVRAGTVSACDIDLRPLEATGGAGYVSFDSASHTGTGTTCYVYRDPVTEGATTGKLYYSILDSTTGAYIQKHVAVASSVTFEYNPRVVVVGDYYLIFGEVSSNTEVKVYSIDTAGSMATPVDQSSALGTVALAGSWDVTSTSSEAVFVFPRTGGGSMRARCIYYSAGFQTTDYDQGLGAGTVYVLAACGVLLGGTTAGAAVLYSSVGEGGTSLRVVTRVGGWVYGPHASAVTASNWGAGMVAFGDVVHVWSTAENGAAKLYVQQAPVNVTSGVWGSATTVRSGCRLASRPFIPLDSSYAWITSDSEDQPQHILVRSDGSLHSRVMYRTANPTAVAVVPTTGLRVPGMRNPATGKYAVALGGYFQTSTQKFTASTSVDWQDDFLKYMPRGAADAVADFSSNAVKGQECEAGKSAYVTGGLLKSYDGVTCAEAGFLTFPEDITWSSSVPGTTKQYTYAAVYEWTDAAGQAVQSAPSQYFAVTSTNVIGTDTITVNVQACLFTEKANVRVKLYRSEVGGVSTIDGLLYLAAEGSADTSGYDTYFRVTLTDNITDAVLVTRPQLYVVSAPDTEREAPGATKSVCTYRQRVFAVSAEHPTAIRLSRESGVVEFPVTVGAEFCAGANYTVPVDSAGGPITALGVVDANLVIFKESRIFACSGTGPDNAGLNTDLTPVAVAAEVGCPYPKSVVQTPNGLLFQSYKGIYLLDRSLSVSYLGAPVEAETASATVVAGLLVPRAYQVRLALSNGRMVVWDYAMNQWSVFTGLSAVGMATWGDEACYISTSGVLYQEDRSVYTDAGSFVQLHVVTAWLQLAGLLGYQRVNHASLLAEGTPSHTIALRLYTDFKSTSDQKVTFQPLTDVPVMQRRLHLKNQKCEAVKLDITDVSVVGTDGGLSLSGLAFEIGVKKGLDKLGPSRSA